MKQTETADLTDEEVLATDTSEKTMEIESGGEAIEGKDTGMNEDDGATLPDRKVDESKVVELHTAVTQISKQIDELQDLFNTRIMHTDHEEKIIDRMHRELQRYREDLYSQLIRPILLDIIAVRDSIITISDTYLNRSEGEQSIPNETFSAYAYDLQDILEKNNVEIYKSNPGEDFTPIRQRTIKQVPTVEEDLHGKVAESLSCGYSYDGRVISPEKVGIYLYKKDCEVIKDG